MGPFGCASWCCQPSKNVLKDLLMQRQNKQILSNENGLLHSLLNKKVSLSVITSVNWVPYFQTITLSAHDQVACNRCNRLCKNNNSDTAVKCSFIKLCIKLL